MESESEEEQEFVIDVETILARLANRGISTGVESEISSVLRGDSGQIVQLVFSRFLEKVSDDAKKLAAAEEGRAERIAELREKSKLEKTWKLQLANLREKAEAAEANVERLKNESRIKLDKMKTQLASQEEEISRFKTRENLLQREIDILVKSLKHPKIDVVETPEEQEPEELVSADMEKETISLTFPVRFEPPPIIDDYELSPSTILRGL